MFRVSSYSYYKCRLTSHTSVWMIILLQDRYAYGRTTPSIDDSQDWVLTGANEEGGFTTLQFERKLDTCDPDDTAINLVSEHLF